LRKRRSSPRLPDVAGSTSITSSSRLGVIGAASAAPIATVKKRPAAKAPVQKFEGRIAES